MATRLDHEMGPARFHTLVEAAKNALARGDTGIALSTFEQVLEIDPGNTSVMAPLAVLHFNSGNFKRAIALFRDACAAAPLDKDLRRNYRKALSMAATVHNNPRESVEWLRTAREFDPENAWNMSNLVHFLEASGVAPEVADFMQGMAADQLGTHLLVACMPKSGSTFLKQTLCCLTNWAEASFVYAYLQNEQEIYLPSLIQVARQNTVTQQHCRATGPNVQILQAFGVKPIVLVRNLADIVLSLSDFYDNGAVNNTFFQDAWPTLDAQGKYNLIIDQVMPWYAGFYASWERARRLGRLDCFFLTYEEMTADKPAAIARISDFLGLGKTPEQCADAVRVVDGDTRNTRFNKGIAGRGEQTLDDDQKARLRRLVSAYGPVDLARVGLAE